MSFVTCFRAHVSPTNNAHLCRSGSKSHQQKETGDSSLFRMRPSLLASIFFLWIETASAWTTCSERWKTPSSAQALGSRPSHHTWTTACSASVGQQEEKAVSSDTKRIITKTATTTNSRRKTFAENKPRRVAVLLCPAQFCVPDDYHDFFAALQEWSLQNNNDDMPITIGTCRVAPLPRTEWIKVAQQLPTLEFLQAKLPVLKTLSWYFDAMDQAVAEILAQEGASSDVNLCIIGHSIGGWVARAYLGGLSLSSTAVHRLAMDRCTSFITLGTPHISPISALVDQTRGLLRAIDESPTCCPQALADRGIDVTCVSSSALSGNFFTTNIEELVAASSYLPLMGRMDGQIKGDGIVPLDLAFMDKPARRVVIDECSLTAERVRHSHVVPTPWNLLDGYAPSIRLPDNYPSYVSPGVLPLWAKYIR